MKKIVNISLILSLIWIVSACDQDKWLEPTLAQDKSIETSITSVEDVQGILYGAYNRMSQSEYYGRNMIIFGSVRSDICFSNGNSGRFTTVGEMKMGETDGYATDAWTQIYRVIASANIIIGTEGQTLEGDQDLYKHYLGQAYTIRALAHYDLLRLFGQQHVTGGNGVGIPYVKEYKGDNLLPARNTVDEVKGFIYADLDKAASLMDATLDDASREYISSGAVEALRSRFALYFGDWATAQAAAEKVINSGTYSIASAASYEATFNTRGASNVIFEIANRPTDNQGIDGLSYIYRGTSYGDIQVLDQFATLFEASDVRASAAMIAVDGGGALRNVGKYPTNSDYDYEVPIIRYEEVVLNYAEALFRQGDAANALTQLNLIPADRGASAYTVANEDNILLEREKELCFEGFRFDDLARTNKDIPVVDAIRQTHGGPAYGSYNYAFPIPASELNANSNMVQNQGY